MLRISKGTTADAKFQTNYKNAKAAGLKVGVYCYSLAQNAAQAKAEGDKVLNILNAQKLDYPVYNFKRIVRSMRKQIVQRVLEAVTRVKVMW